MLTPSEEPASEGAPDWMVSYADMITILMAFFAMMFSMAMAKDAKRDVPMMKSLQRQFGNLGGLPTTFYLPFGAALTTPERESRNRGLVGTFAHASTTLSGDQATIGGVVYFDAGTSGLNDEQRQQLQTLAKAVAGTSQKIEILGRTLGRARDADDKFRDDWNLAHARCHNAMRYLVSLGIDSRRIRLGVAARFEPIHADHDVLPLENNRSVEVFMSNDSTEDARAETTDHARD